MGIEMMFEKLNLDSLKPKIPDIPDDVRPVVIRSHTLTRLTEDVGGFREDGPITVFKDEFLGAEPHGRKDVSKITLKIRKRIFKIIVDGNAADLEKMFRG